LADERGNPSAGQLTVRIAQQSMSDVASDNVEHAQTAAQKLSSPPIVNVADGVTNLPSTASNQMTLETSLGSLLGKVEILVKIGDEVTKVCLSYVRAYRIFLKQSQIHPYVNFAWQVLSLGFKVSRIRSWRHFFHRYPFDR
jgi:hypothetical protein